MLKRLLSFLHTFCRHDDRTVIADIHSGDVGGYEVRWCLICGAINHTGKVGGWELARSPWITWWGRSRATHYPGATPATVGPMRRPTIGVRSPQTPEEKP